MTPLGGCLFVSCHALRQTALVKNAMHLVFGFPTFASLREILSQGSGRFRCQPRSRASRFHCFEDGIQKTWEKFLQFLASQ
jgi:hypothetical protein